MTVKMKKFGKLLITRQDAKAVLQSISISDDTLVLDFGGVTVANHPFADELGKGLIDNFSSCDLSRVKLMGISPYVKNCLEAGFSTAGLR